MIHELHGVCPDWANDHYYALKVPSADMDCSMLEPVDDNSDEYPDRADVVGACEACVAADCLKGTIFTNVYYFVLQTLPSYFFCPHVHL